MFPASFECHQTESHLPRVLAVESWTSMHLSDPTKHEQTVESLFLLNHVACCMSHEPRHRSTMSHVNLTFVDHTFPHHDQAEDDHHQPHIFQFLFIFNRDSCDQLLRKSVPEDV